MAPTRGCPRQLLSLHFAHRAPAAWTLLARAVLALALLTPAQAGAWIERTVESSTATLQVQTDGSAVVRHQLTLSVRGSRLRGMTLRGVDADAKPLPGATITRMKNGRATSLPLAINIVANSGTLEISLPLKRGFRGRHFQLDFSYRTDLASRGLLRAIAGKPYALLSWTSPRFTNGIDSSTLLLQVPSRSRTPRSVPSEEQAKSAAFGVIMSTLRRSDDYDELELVRAHVPKGEAMVWEVQLDRSLGPQSEPDSDGSPATPAVEDSASAAPLPTRTPEPFPNAAWWLALVAFGYSALVWLKAYAVTKGARLRQCTTRSLVGGPRWVRAVLAGGLIGAGGWLLLWRDATLLGGPLAGLAMLLATQLPPRAELSLRAPGRWQPVARDRDLATALPALPFPWLDASRPWGLLLLLTALGWIGWGAVALFSTSPYLGATCFAAGGLLLPIFCTGKASDFPGDPLGHAQGTLARVASAFRHQSSYKVRLMGHQAGDSIDEVRLYVRPEPCPRGLVGFEVAVAGQQEGAAQCVLIVRAMSGSPAHHALQGQLTWTRGRTPDERASLVLVGNEHADTVVDVAAELIDQLRRGERASALANPTRRGRSRRGSTLARAARAADKRPPPSRATTSSSTPGA